MARGSHSSILGGVTSIMFACAILCAAARTAQAQGVYFTNESVLKAFFPESAQVSYVTVETAKHRDELSRLLGYLPPKTSYHVFVAKSGSSIDGYAVIDEQLGQHLPITLATKVGTDGRVARTEIMVYRERYGGEVVEERFRGQFVDKTVEDPIRAGDDIVAISGATISSTSVAVAVKRAAALVGIVRRSKPAPGNGG